MNMTTHLPKVSIITPSFNQGQFLEASIRSVLEQDYPNLEYIVVDGGSKDESVEIIKKYQDRLAWWVSEKDKGHADALNKGFSKVTGDILAWLNSDDIYFPNAVSEAVSVLTQNPKVGMVYGDADLIDDSGATV
jgi:glycosyltransferase involved in cell wall biosynthesis